MSSACCTLPAVVESGYEPKGSIVSYGGFDKTYVVDSPDAKSAIIIVYDIFGISSQIQQGADILSKTLNAKVVVPDFFRGNERDVNNWPPTTPEGRAERDAFFKDIGDAKKRLPELLGVAEALKKDGITRIGALGYCWGGKVSILAGALPDPFSAVAAVHPAFIINADADNLMVPLGFYPSKDEPNDMIQYVSSVASAKPFAAKNDFHHFDTVHHGFAGARAKPSDPENKKQFELFYSKASAFFRKAFET